MIINKPLTRPIIPLSVLILLAVGVVYYTLILNHQQIHVMRPTDLGHSSLGVTSQAQDESLTENNLLKDLNAERQSKGLAPVTEDSRLDQSATQKVTELAQTGWNSNVELNHINPTTGAHGYTYALKDDPSCIYAAENLSYGYSSSDAVIRAWKASAPHLAAMNGDYQTAGVGIDGVFVTLHLCRL